MAAQQLRQSIDIGQSYSNIRVQSYSYWRWDDDNRLALEQISHDIESQFRKGEVPPMWNESRNLSRQLKQPPLWAFFTLHNSSQSPQTAILKNELIISSEIRVYVFNRGLTEQQYKFGTAYPFSEKPIPHRWNLVPVTVLPGEQRTVIVRIVSSGKTVLNDMKLVPESAFSFDSSKELLAYGLVIGFLFIIALASLVVSFLVGGERTYFYYVINIFSMVAIMLSNSGLGDEIFWPNLPWLGGHMFAVSSMLQLFSLLLFSNAFLELAKRSPRVYLLNQCIAVLVAVGLVAVLLLPYESAYRLVVLSYLLRVPVMIVCLIVALLLWKNNFMMARTYFLAWFLYYATIFYLVTVPDSISKSFSMVMFNVPYLFVSVALFASLLNKLIIMRTAAQQALAEGNAKSEFLAKMSHEIRTPMNGVLGMTELLADTKLTVRQSHFVQVIYSSGHTLLDVINEILDFTKFSSGKLVLEKREFDIAVVAADCISLFVAKNAEGNIELACYVAPNTFRLWQGDETRIRQILINLIGNARKFTDTGEIVIALSHSKNHELIISVRDTGVGIKDEDVGKLFQDFQQANASTTRKYGGTGLGLTICKQLTEIMGGKIEVSSSFGIGTTFSLSLPLQPVLGSEQVILNDIVFEGKRLLLIDQNENFCKLVRETFTLQFSELVEAGSSSQALEMIVGEHQAGRFYDLIVVDLGNCEIDNESFVKALSQRNLIDQTAVLLLSASFNVPEEEEYKEWGATYASIKPVLMEGLVKLFSRVLSNDLSNVRCSENGDDEGESEGLHILVAEDNEVNFLVVDSMLRKRAHTLQRACDGIEAVALFKRHNINSTLQPFDLIFMDCEMPNMDGFEATQCIRKLEAEASMLAIPIVALTAHAMSDRLQQCEKSGMNSTVVKPYTQKILQETIAQYRGV